MERKITTSTTNDYTLAITLPAAHIHILMLSLVQHGNLSVSIPSIPAPAEFDANLDISLAEVFVGATVAGTGGAIATTVTNGIINYIVEAYKNRANILKITYKGRTLDTEQRLPEHLEIELKKLFLNTEK